MQADRLTHTFMIVLGLSIMLASGLYAGTVEAAPDSSALIDPFAGDAGPSASSPVAAPADPAIDPIGWATSVYEAVRGGHWAMVAGLALMLVTLLARKLLPKLNWFRTDPGGFALVSLLALLGMAGNAAMAGRMPDGPAVLGAIEALATAVLAYVGVRKLAKAKAKA